MLIQVIRDDENDERSLGKCYVDGRYLGETCEDKDRHLEDGGEKVYGETAIPRGLYKAVLSFSHAFQRVLPELLDVPGYSGVRIHGGNTAADTLGCILLGSVRTPDGRGIAKCAPIVERLISLMEWAEQHGESITVQVE